MSFNYNIGDLRVGNKNEFRKLIDENMDYVYRIAFRIIADEDDARDIVQDTFLKVWEKRKSLRAGNTIRSYLRRITINKSYDMLRRRKRGYERNRFDDLSSINDFIGDDRADYKLHNDEVISIMKNLASALSPRQRIVFTLIELEEMTHDEVEESTGMSKNSIKSNLRHARRKLEMFITDYLN